MMTLTRSLGLFAVLSLSLLWSTAHAALFLDANVDYAGPDATPDRITADFGYDDDDAGTADYFYEWVLSSTRVSGADPGFVESFPNSVENFLPIDASSSNVVRELFPTPGTYEFTVSFTSFHYEPPDRCVGGPLVEGGSDNCVPTYTDGASETLIVSYGVAEPVTLSLLSLGVAGLLVARRRQRQWVQE